MSIEERIEKNTLTELDKKALRWHTKAKDCRRWEKVVPVEHVLTIAKEYAEEQTELPGVEEAGVIAVSLSKDLTPREQAFFVAGFQECIKYLQDKQKLATDKDGGE
jgi:hypothetical protein